LRTSLRKITAEGLPAHIAKHAYASRVVRTGLRQVGFEMFVADEYAAPIATAVKARPEFTVHELLGWLSQERGMAVGGGIGELAGQIFRVGHLGRATTREYLLDFLFAIEEFLRGKGINVPVGASLVGL
jgi:alanine-glyoxylate transaminase/serine-glyoxylate transaminase/serine-pyruvate transaminase